jgi:hypothetical protein
VEVGGEYRLGEAKGAEWLLSKRVSGFGLGAFAIYVAGLVIAAFTVPYLVDLALPEAVTGGAHLLLIVVVCVAFILGWQRWRRANLVKGWVARGVQNPSPTTFRIEDAVLVVAGAQSEIRVDWNAVSEIARGQAFWCLIGPGLGYCLPKRFFSDEAAERAFLRAALARMSEAARARSREATAFVGVWE